MDQELVQQYICPFTKQPLQLTQEKVENGAITEGILQTADGNKFPVQDGIPNFVESAKLGDLELKTQTDYDAVADEIYDNAVDWLFQSFYEDEDKIRENMIDLLNLTPRSRVLEIGSGTGRDSFRIARRLGADGVLYLQDLSRNMVLKTREKLTAFQKENNLECACHYFVSDALHLPFPDQFFDAVFHFGGFNNFSQPKNSLAEITRITQKGGKVVVGDESLPPWLEDTEFGKILITNNSLYEYKVPLYAIPIHARDVTVRWILGSCFYLIDFRVDEGTPPIDLDLPHKGRRGGTMRTRYYGQLEGVTLEAKKMAQEAAQKAGLSLHTWLDQLVREAAKKQLQE